MVAYARRAAAKRTRMAATAAASVLRISRIMGPPGLAVRRTLP
jgi:hypothetical protein